MASTLETKSPEEFTEMVNRILLETNTSIKEIDIAKISKWKNIAIQPVDSTEAQKLQENTNWIRAAFGEEAEPITKWYWVMANRVSIYKVNTENKEASIQYLVDKNRSAFLALSIQWISWLRATQEGKSVASFIIEVADLGVDNCMIDERIVTGADIHSCTVYNLDCSMKQYFRCLQYGLKGVKCTTETICNKCSAQHKANECSNWVLKCAICQGTHGSFDKSCPQKLKKCW